MPRKATVFKTAIALMWAKQIVEAKIPRPVKSTWHPYERAYKDMCKFIGHMILGKMIFDGVPLSFRLGKPTKKVEKVFNAYLAKALSDGITYP